MHHLSVKKKETTPPARGTPASFTTWPESTPVLSTAFPASWAEAARGYRALMSECPESSLTSLAEFGVAELHLINSYRVEKSYWQTPALELDTVREYLLLGLEQARATVLPAIHYHRRFKPFVEDQLPGMISDRQALLAHPGDYPPCPRELSKKTLLVIGPEGGFIPYEVEKLRVAGCAVVSLGPRILRVENAVTGILGRLS